MDGTAFNRVQKLKIEKIVSPVIASANVAINARDVPALLDFYGLGASGIRTLADVENDQVACKYGYYMITPSSRTYFFMASPLIQR